MDGDLTIREQAEADQQQAALMEYLMDFGKRMKAGNATFSELAASDLFDYLSILGEENAQLRRDKELDAKAREQLKQQLETTIETAARAAEQWGKQFSDEPCSTDNLYRYASRQIAKVIRALGSGQVPGMAQQVTMGSADEAVFSPPSTPLPSSLPAAAPDLLAALKDLESFVAIMFGRGPDAVIPETVTCPLGGSVKLREIMHDACAAISKAKGEQP